MQLSVLPELMAPHQRLRGESTSTDDLLAWAQRHFDQRRMVTTTGFGMEGCALIDMLARAGYSLDVIYLDTHFLFPETYALRDELQERYPQLRFINRGTDLTPQEQERQYGPELWKRDPDLCCQLRKVDPMVAALRGVDVWITALRRSQSEGRSTLRAMDWDWQYQLLKFSPLATWSRAQVWEYINANQVPYNPLHERGYPSIGCIQCTKPVANASVTDYSRAGRWQGTEKTECGLHGPGI